MCKFCNISAELDSDYLKKLPPLFRRVMQSLYDNKLQPGEISPELFALLAQELLKGIEVGSGELNSPVLETIMKENVYVFSGFKTYQQLRECTLLLNDDEGLRKPFTKFYQDVKAVNETYNVNYLRAEYNNAVASSQMAANWQDIQSRKDVAPFLRYKTAEDERVRPAHAAMDNIVRRVDDPFWGWYYPPNGWSCRCHVVQEIDAEVTVDFLAPEIPVMFRNNVGESGIIFPDTHPYFNVQQAERVNILSQINKLKPKQ